MLLRQTRGAVRPGRLYGDGSTFTPARDMRRRRGTFDLVDRDGRRVLLVGLREPAGRFKMVPDLGEREDWFTAVDGFVPSLGMGAARLRPRALQPHVRRRPPVLQDGVRARRLRAGLRAPALRRRRSSFVGGELHDLTASDDHWQVSSIEASLAAIGPRRSFRDYYRRRGVQINGGAARAPAGRSCCSPGAASARSALADESDFSLWNDDDPFRPNVVAQDGRLNAVVVGASVDGRGFDRESLEATYRRHQLETPFGERLTIPDGGAIGRPLWRIDWTSEISDARRVRQRLRFPAATSSPAARGCAVASIRISASARSAAGPAACCRRSASSRSAASGRCTATTSRSRSATRWRWSISSTRSAGAAA